MTVPTGLAELIESVPALDGAVALERLVGAALEMSESRNAMLAVMNDEAGLMELRYGAGPEWQPLAGMKVTVDINEEDGIVAYVAAKGESYVSGDVTKDTRYRKLFETTVSELAMPIRDKHGRIRAVLNAESDRPNAYGEDQIRASRLIAGIVAMVIAREEFAKREKALVMVGAALDAAQSEAELLDRVKHVLNQVLHFEAFSVFIWDSAGAAYVLRSSQGNLESQVGHVSYKDGEGCTGWVCETGQPIRLDQPAGDPRWRGKFVEFPSEQIASFLAVPIVGKLRTLGVIRVLRRVGKSPYLDNRFTENDEIVLMSIAEQVATGLESIRALSRLVHSERMIAWGELSAKSSHMIGNRVFALKGDVNELGYQLQQEPPNFAEVSDLQRSLRVNVDRVEEILQDFRDFLTATQLSKVPTDLNKLVSETVDEVFPKRSNIAMKLSLEEQLPLLDVDPVRLRRAVSELIENSLSWVEGGEIEVRTGWSTAEDAARAKLPRSRHYLFISVRDTGPGVPDEKKEVIFQPFQTGRVKGMGLGLSIVKGIAEAHGGTAVESGLMGAGAQFVIHLPAPIRQNADRT